MNLLSDKTYQWMVSQSCARHLAKTHIYYQVYFSQQFSDTDKSNVLSLEMRRL